jgi:hypothetical protein
MEIIRGKYTSFIDVQALTESIAGYGLVHIDIGTGDGRFVQHTAQSKPKTFVIGLDACRENLHKVSQRAPMNSLFVIANARNMPSELHGLATHITINFPWGSLLEGLVDNDASLLTGLMAIAQSNAALEIRLNGGALSEAGWKLEAGAERVQQVLADNGFAMRSVRTLMANDLQSCPTTWAKRLAFGRDPRAMYLRGVRK